MNSYYSVSIFVLVLLKFVKEASCMVLSINTSIILMILNLQSTIYPYLTKFSYIYIIFYYRIAYAEETVFMDLNRVLSVIMTSQW